MELLLLNETIEFAIVIILAAFSFSISTHARRQAASGDRRGARSAQNPSPAADPAYGMKIDLARAIKMRDGVELSADVYRPDAPGKFPMILRPHAVRESERRDTAGYRPKCVNTSRKVTFL